MHAYFFVLHSEEHIKHAYTKIGIEDEQALAFFLRLADAFSTTFPRHAPHKFTMQEVVQDKLNAAQIGGRQTDERPGLA